MLLSICDLPKKQKSPLTDPHKNPDPWDHAQMIERKILCRIALTRAPETQTRPYFFQKYFSIFVNFDPRGPLLQGGLSGLSIKSARL